ncbi:uncharacterized protein (TIGR00369 family) [Antricoccus suffuscus]|uniref:Uncharacterized protein (TIGR00369 family) n=1 Tax=Antricoccus suffuscus TaxID=1629062 RepID=A0A2T1A1S9_9ACTN|nr:PaaI family thioesterase [Antricoccus suffuscus]PRZ42447.1 uncharacterized protein (TIGR00369 family) [Antricoccus suffuscus]
MTTSATTTNSGTLRAGGSSKTITWQDPFASFEAGSKLSGLEYLRAVVDGTIPAPPIGQLMGFRLTAVEPGRAEFQITPDESVYNPIGVVHGGLVCTLLDSAAGCAVHSTLALGHGYTSIELKVNYLRAVHADGLGLRAIGTVRKNGSRVAFADAVVLNADDKEVATASSTLLVFPLPTK